MPDPIMPNTIKIGVVLAGMFNCLTKTNWPIKNPASGPLNKIIGSVKAKPNIHMERVESSFL